MKYQQAKMQTGEVLVEFYASWCPHCRRMEPVVEELKELLNGHVPFYQYDIDEYPEDADVAGVATVPTFILYRNGREVWRESGEIPGDKIMAAIERMLPKVLEVKV
ncbi:MAG: thioredoxin family protein [Muribaculaceae bacterium]|nr:thioredoxin family protein [Muribaculaceae bacterium]